MDSTAAFAVVGGTGEGSGIPMTSVNADTPFAVSNTFENSGWLGVARTTNFAKGSTDYTQILGGASGTIEGKEFSVSTHNDLIGGTDEAHSGGLNFALNVGDAGLLGLSHETFTGTGIERGTAAAKGLDYYSHAGDLDLNRTETRLRYTDLDSGLHAGLIYTGPNWMQTAIHRGTADIFGDKIPNFRMPYRGVAGETGYLGLSNQWREDQDEEDIE
jgi:hypothetical protein